MKLILTKKPKNATIVEGFPGFGLIGTIATEFLMEHLTMEKIGTIEIDDTPAMIAIHGGKVIEPVSIHYNKKYNLVIVHALNIGKNAGWQLADVVLDLAKQVTAKEIISLEGVGSPTAEDNRIFYYSSKKGTLPALEGMASPLMEGVIVGVTGALLAKNTTLPLTALFAEAKSNMPDSKAAAHIIQALDAYLGLEVNPQPLLKQAQVFEQKLRGILQKGQKAQEVQEEKHLSYVG